MSANQIKDIIDQLAQMNVMYITFTGGEVFTRRDFIEIFDYAIEKGTPILEGAASAIREKAIVVTKEVLNKLEKEEK